MALKLYVEEANKLSISHGWGGNGIRLIQKMSKKGFFLFHYYY